MKDLKLVGVQAISAQDANKFVLQFVFDPHIRITGTMGKVITVEMGTNFKASDLADHLIKAGNMLYDELKKG